MVYNKKEQEPLADYFKDLSAGISVGILTEAGCPGIADPGAELIAEAHRKGIKVVPLVGPSSILLAMAPLRGHKIDLETLQEFGVLCVKFGALHLLLQFSGFYSNVFPPVVGGKR